MHIFYSATSAILVTLLLYVLVEVLPKLWRNL